MSVKRGLGRGFDSLIPTELFDESFDPTADQDDKTSDLRIIATSQIYPDGDQPRKYFDEKALDELTASIAIHGVVQPIVVSPRKGGGYTIVAGERRYRAAGQAKLEKIPAIVRTLSNQHKLELSLIENLQRKDLNILETATAYVKLRDQFNLTMEEIGARVGGKSQSAISNTLRLLRLPENAKRLIAEGKLSEGQARPLINLDTELIDQLLPKIISESWSARRIEAVIATLRQHKKSSTVDEKVTQPGINLDYEPALKKLNQRFAAPVSIKANQKGAGKITISFSDNDELKRLLKTLDRE